MLARVDIKKILMACCYAIIPLMVLLFFAALAALISYFILLWAGDIVSMRKLLSKAAQIFLLFSIFPLRRYLNLSWADVGFAPKKLFFSQIGKGLLLGLLTLSPVMLVLYSLDIQIIDQTKQWTVDRVLIRSSLALLLALLISFGEEPLFSGILLAGLRKKMTACWAVLLTATYYSAFHFVKTKTHIPYQELHIGSGFQLMGEAFANILNPEIVSAFIALLVVGIFLATIRTEFASSIGICIGCHAAWVWQIKLGKDFFNTNPESEYYYLVSAYYDGVVGYLVAIWLALAIAAYFVWKKYNKYGL